MAFALLGAQNGGTQTPTKLPTGQLVPVVATVTPAVQVWTPSGGFTLAVLDTTLVLDASTTPPTLRAPGAAQQTWVYNEAWPIGSTPPTSITLRNALVVGTEELYRNGLRQTPGLDFTMAGNVLTFVPANALVAGDNVLVDYRSQ